MPDAIGILTLEERKLIQKWIEGKGALKQCPSCGENSFSLADHLIAPSIHWGDGSMRLGGGPVYPMFMVVCANCAHTFFFNAVMSGVVAKSDEPTETDDGSE